MAQVELLTQEACQPSLGIEGIGWKADPPKACDSMENWLLILRKHLVHPTPKLI